MLLILAIILLIIAIAGGVIGLVGARFATRLISSMMYGISPNDGASFVAGGIVLIAIAAVACVVPMRRAVAVDPLIAMRAD